MTTTKKFSKIGLITSGGDAPGMNAAIRSVVRTAHHHNIETYGYKSGYYGLLNNDFKKLHLGSVANIIQRGGTVLKTRRCLEFHQKEARAKAYENLKNEGIDAFICIGGNGSFNGAQLLSNEHDIPIIGIPATIDNDIYGSELSIGFDSAVNTAVQAIDKIRDTAASHDRLFIVEVMGRDSGFIATEVGLACGAEAVLVPEHAIKIDDVIAHIQQGIERSKKSSILVAAEGQKPGRAYDLAESIRKKSGYDAKVCILGHVQRGGSPTAIDRNLASRMGASAIKLLLEGKSNVFIGLENNKIIYNDISVANQQQKPLPKSDLDLLKILSH